MQSVMCSVPSRKSLWNFARLCSAATLWLIAGTEGLVNAIIDMFTALKNQPAGQIKLQNAVLLLSMSYCLAARHATSHRGGHATEGPLASHGDSPWQPDQELAIKVSWYAMLQLTDLPLVIQLQICYVCSALVRWQLIWCWYRS